MSGEVVDIRTLLVKCSKSTMLYGIQGMFEIMFNIIYLRRSQRGSQELHFTYLKYAIPT